jgi:hypothetical protein
MIDLPCPVCATLISANDRDAGWAVQCPKCGAPVRVPKDAPQLRARPAAPVTETALDVIEDSHHPMQVPVIEPAVVRQAKPYGSDPQAHPGPYRVRCTARIIQWPTVCACCGDPPARMLPIQSGQWSGSCIERRSWDIPYCRPCAKHVELFRLENQLTAQAKRVFQWWPVAGVLAVTFAFVLIGVFTPLREPVSDAVRAEVWWNFAWTAVIAAVVGGPVLYLSVSTAARVQRLRADAEVAIAKAKASYDGRRCCSLGDAVAYLLWDGSIHTFLFWALGYAEAFADANDGKMLVS